MMNPISTARTALPVDLQIALRHAFILVAAAFQKPAGRCVFGQAARLDPAQIQRRESMVDKRRDRLAHVALPRERLPDPVSGRARLRRAAPDIVERDGPQ